MKITAFILVVGVCLTSCGPAKAPAVPTPTPAVSQSKSDTKGPKDYKAIFGPDYKKGDIGHSKGVVIEKAAVNNVVTIKHGVIHGIDRGASTTEFESLETVDISPLSSGANVEFLVKKGPDDIYHLFKICEILEAGKSCL